MRISHLSFKQYLNANGYDTVLDDAVGGQQLIALINIVGFTGARWRRAAPTQAPAFPGVRQQGAVQMGTGRQGGGGGGQGGGTYVRAYKDGGSYQINQGDANALCNRLHIPTPPAALFHA